MTETSHFLKCYGRRISYPQLRLLPHRATKSDASLRSYLVGFALAFPLFVEISDFSQLRIAQTAALIERADAFDLPVGLPIGCVALVLVSVARTFLIRGNADYDFLLYIAFTTTAISAWSFTAILSQLSAAEIRLSALYVIELLAPTCAYWLGLSRALSAPFLLLGLLTAPLVGGILHIVQAATEGGVAAIFVGPLPSAYFSIENSEIRRSFPGLAAVMSGAYLIGLFHSRGVWRRGLYLLALLVALRVVLGAPSRAAVGSIGISLAAGVVWILMMYRNVIYRAQAVLTTGLLIGLSLLLAINVFPVVVDNSPALSRIWMPTVTEADKSTESHLVALYEGLSWGLRSLFGTGFAPVQQETWGGIQYGFARPLLTEHTYVDLLARGGVVLLITVLCWDVSLCWRGWSMLFREKFERAEQMMRIGMAVVPLSVALFGFGHFYGIYAEAYPALAIWLLKGVIVRYTVDPRFRADS